MKPELKTERLTLKPIAASDLNDLQRIFTNEFVRKYLFDDEILERKQIEDFIRISEETFRDKKFGLWLIFLRRPLEPIGFAGLWHFFDENQPQLLYALLPQHAGRGFAVEAARRIVEYAFSELSFKRLDASCDVANADSQRVAEKLGMRKFKEEALNEKPTAFFRLENE